MKTATTSQKLLSIDKSAKMRPKRSRSKKANKSPDFVRKKVIALNSLQKKMITLEPTAPIRAAKERINSKKKQLQKKKSFSRTLRPPVITSVTVAPAPLPPRGFSFSISQDSVQLKSIVRSSSTPTAQKSVSFGTCILRYFKRSHGTCVIPEETGDATTLGLGEEYPFSTIHYQLSSIIDNDEDSLWRLNKAYRSTKLSIRERQMLLLAAAVEAKDRMFMSRKMRRNAMRVYAEWHKLSEQSLEISDRLLLRSHEMRSTGERG
uniref:Uncharacterized protein n=1 Tax=Plectus sambesii TaxID=2011161 RepID=A0A914W2T0_9BILA